MPARLEPRTLARLQGGAQLGQHRIRDQVLELMQAVGVQMPAQTQQTVAVGGLDQIGGDALGGLPQHVARLAIGT